jgi:hypothetical protein
MRSPIITVFTLLLLLTSTTITTAQTAKDFAKMRAKWIYTVSKKVKKLPPLYLKQAMMVKPDENIFGQDAIRMYVADHPREFKKYSSSESLQLFKHSDRKVLDVGYLNIEDDLKNVVDRKLYVVAWRKIDDTWLRELDIILPSDNAQFGDDELADVRSTWVKYANGNDPAAMVSTLFLPDAVYLNNSQASTGHLAITGRLDFIKNPAFSINLKNEKFIKVDDSTAIDIGNWLTSEFVGYYLILWKVDEAGEWKISLYFNY